MWNISTRIFLFILFNYIKISGEKCVLITDEVTSRV